MSNLTQLQGRNRKVKFMSRILEKNLVWNPKQDLDPERSNLTQLQGRNT
jgi:hypothetical protein